MSFVGWLSVVLYFVSLAGISHQVLHVRARAACRSIPAQQATDGISAFYVSTAFLSTAAYILFNLTLSEINHYLLWPRIFQVLLFLLLLREVAKDRRCGRSRALSLLALVGFVSILYFIPIVFFAGREPVQMLHDVLGGTLVGLAALVGIGIVHQVREVWRRKHIGALSLRKEGAGFVKDVSSLGAAVVVTPDISWQLLFTHGSSALLVGSLYALMLWYEYLPKIAAFRVISFATLLSIRTKQ